MRQIAQRRVGRLAARPTADDEQMARLVEILDQLVVQVAVEEQHVRPDRPRDPNPLVRRLRRELRLPDRIDAHRRLLVTLNYKKDRYRLTARRSARPACTEGLDAR